jgi:16S rRNA (guanine527-N7)-methyltransferase
MKGKQSAHELSDVPRGFAMRETHVLAVPGLEAERRLLVLGHA